MKIYLLDQNPDMVAEWKKVFNETFELKIVNDNFRHFMDTHKDIDGIVSPANSYGVMSGGYDAAIIEYLGEMTQTNVFTILDAKYYGYQPVGSCMAVCYGKHVILHTPTMRIPEEIIDPRVIYDCTYACLAKAKTCHLKAIVIPAFGACTGKVPLRVVARLMHYAFSVFNNKHVHFGTSPNLYSGIKINERLKEIINDEDITGTDKIEEPINITEGISNSLTVSDTYLEGTCILTGDYPQATLADREEYINNHAHLFKSNLNMQVEFSEPKYKCPKCGGNVRKNLTMVLTSYPPKYRYECDNCDHVDFHEF